MKNIVLIGLPGSGKTTLGQELAAATGRAFADLDDRIREREGRTIEEIFRDAGEEGFRRAETAAAVELANAGGMVVACGGGAVLRKENMELLGRRGVIVFLDRPAEQILATVDLSDRPLLRRDPNYLLALQSERRHLYEEAADFLLTATGRKEALEKGRAIADLLERDLRLAVIGDPIDHSLSPDIHRGILAPLCPRVRYERVRVAVEDLGRFLEDATREGYDGFNVTMPCKQAILPYLDEIAPDAAAAGAVNTVVIKGDRRVGSSTDGRGFAAALQSAGRSFTGSRIVLLGAGGAAASLALRAAWDRAGSIRIYARDPAKANALAALVNRTAAAGVAAGAGFDRETDAMEGADLLINATPMGMAGTGQAFPGYRILDRLAPDALVCDLVYRPAETELLSEAKRRGFSTLGGLPMLLHQAIEADRHFTGTDPGPHRAIRRAMAQLELQEKQKEKEVGI